MCDRITFPLRLTLGREKAIQEEIETLETDKNILGRDREGFYE